VVQASALDLAAIGLPDAWGGWDAWTVLDTDFRDGQRFLNLWRAWQRDPRRPRLLHYVGIASVAPHMDVHDGVPDCSVPPHNAQALADQLPDRGPGFHRILLSQAQVSLTLCIGDAQALLSEHVFQADTLLCVTTADKWAAQLLARRCKRGTRFWMDTTSQNRTPVASKIAQPVLLQAAGFELDSTTSPLNALCGTFNPRWDIRTSRTPSQHVVHTPGRCAVIGAGIAGASIAHAMALRGWQVTVIDQEAAPAAGASGLPAGLAVPHVSADDNPRSRLSRNGTRLLMQHADHLLVRGQDWEPSGVLERRPDGGALWHPQACWIKPAALVKAWLASPGVTFVGNTKIAALTAYSGGWTLGDPMGQDLGTYAVVVVANAMGCAALMQGLESAHLTEPNLRDKVAALQPIHGTLSYGTYAEVLPGLPVHPVNGNGCFIPHVPSATGEQWLAGSTFEPDALVASDLKAQHVANMERLRQLLPVDGFDLADTLDRGPVGQWSATRCVTHDRLPLVGPIETTSGSGLWLCVGMGARGLSFSALCAELLVARLGAEPLPVEFSLSGSLDANRAQRLRLFAADPSPAGD
jgi:tRNA 5-methylaminomethyl-2-thiouridine biosynthesis bifunctional protein